MYTTSLNGQTLSFLLIDIYVSFKMSEFKKVLRGIFGPERVREATGG
jgi:hypothetical protein